MSDQSLPAGAGPSPDDQPFVPSGNPNPLPAGEVFKTDPDRWYRLKVNYIDEYGNPVTGYAYPVGKNAADSYWNYVVLSAGPAGSTALQFKLHPPDNWGWSTWEIHNDPYNDGYHLSCKATGFLYRASAYDVRFQIVDSKLNCSYWGGPQALHITLFLFPLANIQGWAYRNSPAN